MKDNKEVGRLQFEIQKIDETRRIVFGVVYQPNKIDAFGWFMEPEEVEKMCHRFMKLNLSTVIDTNHDNIPNGSYPVQSFIARAGDPDYEEGSWILGVKIIDETLWQEIVDGKLNAYSMEIMVKKQPATVTYEVVPTQIGQTEESEDHEHYFIVAIDDNGRVIKGMTSVTNGHSHVIDVNSVTEIADNHSHRYILNRN